MSFYCSLHLPHCPFFVNSKNFQPMSRQQIKFGLIRSKTPSAHLPLLQFAHCRSLRSLGLSCLFLTFSSFFSSSRWKEIGVGAAGDWASPGVAGPWVRAPQEHFAGISKLQSSGPGASPLAGQRVQRGQGPSDICRGLSVQDAKCPSELRQPSLSGWILCELPHWPSLAPNHKFSPT